MVADLPAVCAAGREIADATPEGARLTHHPVDDFIRDELPGGFEVVFQCDVAILTAALFARAAGALVDGGRFIAVERWFDAGEPSGPPGLLQLPTGTLRRSSMGGVTCLQQFMACWQMGQQRREGQRRDQMMMIQQQQEAQRMQAEAQERAARIEALKLQKERIDWERKREELDMKLSLGAATSKQTQVLPPQTEDLGEGTTMEMGPMTAPTPPIMADIPGGWSVPGAVLRGRGGPETGRGASKNPSGYRIEDG